MDFESGDFTIDGAPAHVDYMTAFYFMNFTAATAVCATAGVPLEAAIRAGESFTVSRVRYDEFDVDGRRAILMLTKQNPVSLDQNIDYVITQPGPKTVALYVNNVLYTEGQGHLLAVRCLFRAAGGPGGPCGLLRRPGLRPGGAAGAGPALTRSG